MRPFLVLLLTMLLAAVAGAQTTRSALFVGNSYSYFHQMPRTVSRLASSLGDSLIWEERLGSQYSYARHWNSPATYAALSEGRFDAVFLQEYHLVAAYPPPYFEVYSVPYFDSLRSLLESHGACTRLFAAMPWAREAGDVVNCLTDPYVCSYGQMWSRIEQNFAHLRAARGVSVAPWGAVWDYVRAQYPWIDLYDPQDRHHPNKAGSYLVACTNYALIFRKSPVGGYLDPELPEAVCRALQEAVWAVLPQLGDEWGFTTDLQTAGFEVTELSSQHFRLTSRVQEAQSWHWETASGEHLTGREVEFSAEQICPALVRHWAVVACDTLAFEGFVAGADGLQATAAVQHPTCAGLADGSISLFSENTTGVAAYFWSTGQQTETVSGLSAGTYTVTIHDPSGCSSAMTLVLENQTQHDIQLLSVPTCGGNAMGRVWATSSGDGSPTAWLWSDGTTDADIGQLSSGVYTVTCSFGGGCTRSATALVANQEACTVGNFSISNITDTQCNVHWQPSGCAQAYRCEYRKSGIGHWEEVALPLDKNLATIQDLTAATEYEMRLRVHCHDGAWLSSETLTFETAVKWYYDADLDSFGADSLYVLNVAPDEYLTSKKNDCNDTDTQTNPNAAEFCDQQDNNCNNLIDEAAVLLCRMPAALMPVQVGRHDITVQWLPAACAMSYNLRYRDKNEPDWNSIILPPDELSASVEGLAAAHEYWFSIRSECSPNKFSNWSAILKIIASDTAYPSVLPQITDTTQWKHGEIRLQPNPVNSHMWVRASPDFVPEYIQVVTPQGGIMFRQLLGRAPISVEGLPEGLYFLQAFTADGRRAAQPFLKI